MANKYAGLGAKLMHGVGITPTYTAVPSCKTLGGPKADSTQIDTTTLDALGGYETFVMGLKKPGTVSFELVWDPADPVHQALFTDYDSARLAPFQIVWPDTAAEQFAFSAYVKAWETKAAPNTDLSATFELQISGPVTRTP